MYKKLSKIQEGTTIVGCANCGKRVDVLKMEDEIYASGYSYVKKNGQEIYHDCCGNNPDIWKVQDAENMASKEPNEDWRIYMQSAFHGEEYQRQGEELWVIVQCDEGYA